MTPYESPRPDYPLKRSIDVVLSVVAITLSAPVWIPLAVAIKLESPGPVLHRARRVGRGGALFTLYKFRSMRVGAAGPAVTAGNDTRITRTGRLIRKAKLDEIPQLLNVLRGDMSLVGPRPEDPRYVDRYTPCQRSVLDVRPGITGSAAVAYRHEETLLAASTDVESTYVNVVMPAKLELELGYLREIGLKTDLMLILKTVLAIVKPAGDAANV